MWKQFKDSSFVLWVQQVNIWPQYFIVIILLILLMTPLSLMLLVLIPYTIQTINSTPAFMSWQSFLGEQMGSRVQDLLKETSFATGLTVEFQREGIIFLLIGISLVYGFANYYSDSLLRDMGEKLAQKLRIDISKKYLSLTYKATAAIDAGLLSSMVGEDTREAQLTFTRLINSILKDGFISIFFLLWLIFLDYKSFILFITVLIPAGIVLRVTGKVLKKLSRQGLQFESELLSGILERMKGWQIIQVHRALNLEIINFNRINSKIFHVWKRAARARALGSPLVETLGIIAATFIIVIALRRISLNELNSNILTSFMVTIGFLSDRINRMSNQFNTTKKGTECLRRIKNFLNQNLEVRFQSGFLGSDNVAINKMEVNNLSIGNGETVLIEKLNASLEKGSITVVIGPSGIGKSTFIRTLLGVQQPLGGTILINKDLANDKLFDMYSKRICFIPQEPFLFSGTIFDNVTYPDKVLKPDEKELFKVEQALNAACLVKPSAEFISNLSGGEKQRVMFARIFYRQPDFVIIDEGTSALDLNNEIKIIENLKEHLKNSIVVIVAHRTAIRDYATNIIDFSKYKKITENILKGESL